MLKTLQRYRKSRLITLCLFLGMGLLATCQNPASVRAPKLPETYALRVRGDQIVNAMDEPVRLRGVTFENRTLGDDPFPRNHHGAIDYQRVAEMGMNTVRFQMSYRSFEKDIAPGQFLEEGWRWLEDNINWAAAAGVYLILTLELPPGAQPSNPDPSTLWLQSPIRDRFVALWRGIAEHCRGAGILAGYDLLHEPHVPWSSSEWQELATRTIEAIREVDPHHIIFLERVQTLRGIPFEDEQRNFVKVADPNVVYEFHFYRPVHFTHQRAPWMTSAAEYTRYPDPERLGIPWFLIEQVATSMDDPTLPAGDSDWQYYEGSPVAVTDPTWVIGRPTLVSNDNPGVVYFDNLLVEKLDPNGAVEQEVRSINLTTRRGWTFTSENGSGKLSERQGRNDAVSLALSGTTGPAFLTSDYFQFELKPGATYRISGWMKGERIPEEADCRIRLDLLSAQAPIGRWDKKFLAQELDAYLAWGKRYGVPMFLGEFGTTKESFQRNRGGLRWVSDMLDLLEKRKLHFAYRAYHDNAFGIYYGDNELPNPEQCNKPLIELFKRNLRGLPPPGPEIPSYVR